MEQTKERPAPGRRRSVITAVTGGVVAAGLAVGLTMASLNPVRAQTPGPATPKAEQKARTEADLKGRRDHGPGHLGMRMRKLGGPAIHGELTVKKKDGGYQTMATQLGEVTSVSSSSIAVESEDGFARTYSIDDKTRVMAGREGIEDVKKGDTVRVMAVVDGDEARSVHILDVTTLKDFRGKLKDSLPKRPAA